MPKLEQRVDNEILGITEKPYFLMCTWAVCVQDAYILSYAWAICVQVVYMLSYMRVVCVQGVYMLVNPWKLEDMNMQRF
jgi:hypothetical protein